MNESNSHPTIELDRNIDNLTTTWPLLTNNNISWIYTNLTLPEERGGHTKWQHRHPSEDTNLWDEVLIPPYLAIFLFAVTGNLLVILTLVQNKRMRTVTNVFLLNLSVSDLLLAVFCMPFTLIPVLLRNFIFGAVICVMIRYLQAGFQDSSTRFTGSPQKGGKKPSSFLTETDARWPMARNTVSMTVSVSVSCFTLVAMSLERYFAICRPLHSRQWQTLSHAYKTIAACWILALIAVLPIAVYTKLISSKDGEVSFCRERWPTKAEGQAYTVFLDWILLLIPVIIMSCSYGSIVRTLWIGIKMDMRVQEEAQYNKKEDNIQMSVFKETSRINTPNTNGTRNSYTMGSSESQIGSRGPKCYRRHRYDIQSGMRQSNIEKNVAAKKRVIKMLCVVVLEYFICWTPLFFTQTWKAFDQRSLLTRIPPVGMYFIHLLSYVSSCCNPITYCFMNKKFRQAFLSAFCCFRKKKSGSKRRESVVSGNTGMSLKSNLTEAPTQFEKVQEYNNINDSDEFSE